MINLQEHEFDVSEETDPITFSQAMSSANSLEWMNAMKDKLGSMQKNQVRDRVKLPTIQDQLDANGSLRPKKILKVKLRDTRLD